MGGLLSYLRQPGDKLAVVETQQLHHGRVCRVYHLYGVLESADAEGDGKKRLCRTGACYGGLQHGNI